MTTARRWPEPAGRAVCCRGVVRVAEAGDLMVWFVPDPEHGPGDLATRALVTGNRSRLKECMMQRCPPSLTTTRPRT